MMINEKKYGKMRMGVIENGETARPRKQTDLYR